jgi:hypothetical protein
LSGKKVPPLRYVTRIFVHRGGWAYETDACLLRGVGVCGGPLDI